MAKASFQKDVLIFFYIVNLHRIKYIWFRLNKQFEIEKRSNIQPFVNIEIKRNNSIRKYKTKITVPCLSFPEL